MWPITMRSAEGLSLPSNGNIVASSWWNLPVQVQTRHYLIDTRLRCNPAKDHLTDKQRVALTDRCLQLNFC